MVTSRVRSSKKRFQESEPSASSADPAEALPALNFFFKREQSLEKKFLLFMDLIEEDDHPGFGRLDSGECGRC